ncbi:MAG TPA: CsgE family curli-type amyloid fiber assembly protein [Paludibacter sp.]|nr:CsgE family curli-type amyloid fiber assembly protein [Paludibacter sp.]
MKVIYKTEQVIHQPIKLNDTKIEIDGLLVNKTETKPGHEFYNLFYNGWRATAESKNYQITVSEKPFRLTSIMIVVFVNENLIYQDILQSEQEVLENQAREAILRAQNYLAKYRITPKPHNGENPIVSGNC